MRTSWHPAVIAALIVFGALAGCVDQAADPEDPPVAEAPPAPVDNRTLETFAPGCVQYSGGIIAEAAGFEGFVPPGFQLSRDQQTGQLVQLALIVNVCEDAVTVDGAALDATGSFAMVAVPVLPPEELIDANYSRNLVVVRLVVADEALAARFHDWGLAVAEVGSVTAARVGAPVGELHEVDFAGAASYEVRAPLAPQGQTFARNNYRAWIHDGSNVTAALYVDNMEGPRIGQGAHGWSAEGDDVLPANSSGVVTVGSGIDVFYRWRAVDAPNPAPIGTASSA